MTSATTLLLPPLGRQDDGDLLRCRTRLHPLPALGAVPLDALHGAVAVVLGGTTARRLATAGALGRSGARTRVLGDDLDLTELALVAADADLVVDLNVTGSGEVRPGAWRGALERTYAVLRAVAARWSGGQRVDACSYVVVTAHGGALGSEPSLIEQPLSGIWAGLAKTLPRELPTCRVRVVDLPDDDDPGPAVVAELVAGRLFEVGRRDGQRSALVPSPFPPDDVDRPPALAPDPGAAVLITGGGRGIGYHLGRHLRARWGCRVIVTGRLDLDDVDPRLAALGAEEFGDLTQQRLRACRGGPQLREVRRELGALARGRELWRNLEDARRAGVDLEYRVCDVTDAAAVAALLHRHDGQIAAVIHDAGIDRPARVAAKHFPDVAAVVATKVDGLLHLLAAPTADPAPICAVGSLTGRFGGTAGQSDYAGANEGLARLTEWAGRRRTQPVTCLSWPTWQGLGLITNPSAAVREMSAVGLGTGLRAWEGELRRPHRGEVLFLADVGPMTPPQARGTAVPSDHPGAADLLARRRRLGEPVQWAPGSVLHSRHRLSTRTLIAATGFHLGGEPGIPVSVVVDLMLDAVEWLLAGSGEPDRSAGEAPGPPLRTVVSGLTVQLAGLVLPPRGAAEVLRTAHAVGAAVTVGLARVDQGGSGSGRSPAAVATLTRQPGRTEPGTAQPDQTGPVELPAADGQGVTWSAPVMLLSRRPVGARWVVAAETLRGSDLHAGPHPPEPLLAAGALEAVLWASCPPHATADWVLHIERLDLHEQALAAATLGELDPGSGAAECHDATGRRVLSVEGLRWSPPSGSGARS